MDRAPSIIFWRKITFVLGVFFILTFSVNAFLSDYRYTAPDGSEVFFNECGEIIAINDNVQLMCRQPNQCELDANHYLPMSCAHIQDSYTMPDSIKIKLGIN